ncbi:hypothetical protein [Williamsia deligens]|uniref:Mce-associated membrane protein n=1 Tax=Williamsia deligens TaxID=321325 RepID=A0ABW3G2R3_9NOCA|nr:hypothetical protein [Williamsia deligens]MCP2194685.1 hypothetical protein [Williamsia deligens]
MTDDPTPEVPASRRLTVARERVRDAQAAVDAARAALEDANPGDGTRGRRWGRTVVATSVLALVVAVAAALVGVILIPDSGSGDDTGSVVAASTAAVTTVLTADPAHPDRYLAAARDVSGGEFRRRIDAAAPAITAAVAGLSSAGSGQVVAAGVVGSAPASGPADVLVVAEATAPELVGGSSGDRRIVLSVTMIRRGDRWVIGQVTPR